MADDFDDVDNVEERELLIVEVAVPLLRVLQQQVHREGEAEHEQEEQAHERHDAPDDRRRG